MTNSDTLRLTHLAAGDGVTACNLPNDGTNSVTDQRFRVTCLTCREPICRECGNDAGPYGGLCLDCL